MDGWIGVRVGVFKDLMTKVCWRRKKSNNPYSIGKYLLI